MTHSYLIVFIFGLIIFLPTALYKYVQASSMSFGLSLSLVALVAYLTLSRRRLFFEMRFVLLIVFSLLLVLVLSTFSYFFDEVYFEFSRFIGSFFYLAIVLILSYCFCLLLVDVNESLFRRTLNSIFYLLAFDGLYSTIGYYFFGQAKNLILFTEPSHFAIAFSPFFLYQMVENYNVKFRLICIILVVAFISIIFKSLVLLASLFVALLIVLKKRDAIIYAILCSFIVFINISELSYFITRLDFSGESKNLSVLVFLSGYERAFLSIKDTFGLGIGFQQMGYLGQDGKYMGIIFDLTGYRVNYNDGGTVSSKIVSELGIFGVFLLFFYLVYFIKSFYRLRKFLHSNINNILPWGGVKMFLTSVYLMTIVVLFIRGTGYFTSSSFLFLTSLYFLASKLGRTACSSPAHINS